MKALIAIRLLAVSSLILLPSSIVSAQGSLTPPPGPPGPTMKTLDQIEPRTPVNAITCPGNATNLYVISQPGSYCLTGNVTGVAGKNGIRITARGACLDLKGFTVTGAGGAGLETGIVINATEVQVMNGSITGWPGSGVGAVLSSGYSAILTRVSCYAMAGNGSASTGFSTEPGSILTDCTANDNGTHGFLLKESTLVRCTARGNLKTGFITNGDRPSVFQQCVATENKDGFGIGGCSVLTDCAAFDNTATGLRGEGVFTNCTSSSNGTGFSVSTTSRLTNCAAVDSVSLGIEAEDRCSLESCSATASGGDGIVCGNYCMVLNCSAVKNAGDGIKAAGKSVIRGSLCSQNGTAGTGAGIHTTAGGNHIEGNETRDNLGHGIKADAGPGNDSILRNSSGGNPVNYSPTTGAGFAPIQSFATQTSPVANH